MDALQAAGVEGLAYDSEGFSLRVAGVGPEDSVHFSLANARAEFAATGSDDERGAVLARYVHFLAASPGGPGSNPDAAGAVPALYADARAGRLPVVRSRMTAEGLRLQMAAGNASGGAAGDAPASGTPPVVPFTSELLAEFLAVSLSYDTPTTITFVPAATLEGWGLTLGEALELARENLAAISADWAWERLAPGLWRSPWRDNHDAARLLLSPEIFAPLGLRGRPVAVAPHRDALLVCGSEDDAALAALAFHAEEEIKQPRRLSPATLVLGGADRWSPFLPPPGSPARAGLRRCELLARKLDADEQGPFVERLLAARGEDVFVARLDLAVPPPAWEAAPKLTGEAAGEMFSSAVWTRGVDTLLPRAERVFFMDLDLPEADQLLGWAPWERVETVAGGRLHPDPRFTYPGRFRAADLPDAGQLAALELRT